MASPTGVKTRKHVYSGAELAHLQDQAALPLTPEQKAIAAEYMERYPKPLRALITVYPSTYRKAVMLGATFEDLNQTCCLGVIRATRTWNPAIAGFDTYALEKMRGVVWWWCAYACRAMRYPGNGAFQPDEDKDDERAAKDVDLDGRIDAVDKVGRYLRYVLPRERLVLRLRYGFDGVPMTHKEIAAALGIKRQRVHQIENRAFERIRKRVS